MASDQSGVTRAITNLSTRLFYGKRVTAVVPADPAISDDEGSDEEDDDVADPDFIPLTHKKVDLDNQALHVYQHVPPDFIETPYAYFSKYFSPRVIKHIAYQTNLYATQKDVNTTFTTTEDEVRNFVAILLYMGISELPSIEDYWAMETRVPQVANIMSSKRFRLMRRLVHFNDNTQIPGTIDRFFKVRPLFNHLVTVFRSEPQTPKQSVDEVMVAYKGKTAGNLRQYIKSKPDKWGFKLFARASEDGFIHDLVLYQGKTTLQAHSVPMTSEQQAMGVTSQIVSVLASTMSSSTTTAIFADNFFTSLEIVRYLKDKNCRYTGTARDTRIGKPPLKSIKDMEKKAVPRGVHDYVTSDDGILALRWKDNRVISLLSTDMGVEPISSVYRYCSDTKRKEPVSCPAVIKSYNANMGGIDKSDMLVHLYRTPMKSKRWYMRMFAYAIDVSLTNAWIMYRRDIKALAVDDGLSLKNFRIQVFRSCSSQRPVMSRPRRSSTFPCAPSTSVDVPMPIRGHRSHTPDASLRFDTSLFHAPVYTNRQTCKYCSRKGNIFRSNVVCRVCKVHLCLNAERNCFIKYHEAVA
ncbi:piggyBac transposable element-derived protein 3-like [Onychostoma macrolepis]|uniref:piggyBac transposable element-derived protein 3-like n=1 Tax=Onychostoma macrolepis TaxID=369639 RepID=UPI00272A3B9B|nr:piggyBac transposable element-derived protein 3-like [Onychostoma macrolepis]